MSVDLVRGTGTPAVPRLDVVVTGLSSDAHTWNLVYLQLLLEELGCRTANLGPCMPETDVAYQCTARRPDLIVVGSLNGHGYADGHLRGSERLRHDAAGSDVAGRVSVLI